MFEVALVALKAHRYAGRLVAKGEHYYVRSKDDAKVLKALGFAQDAPPIPAPAVPPETPVYHVEAYISDNGMPGSGAESEPSPPAEPMRTKRTYRRRDLTAEE